MEEKSPWLLFFKEGESFKGELVKIKDEIKN